MGGLCDLAVGAAVGEETRDRPPLCQLFELVQRAEVAEEALGLVDVAQRQNRLEESGGVVVGPVVSGGDGLVLTSWLPFGSLLQMF